MQLDGTFVFIWIATDIFPCQRVSYQHCQQNHISYAFSKTVSTCISEVELSHFSLQIRMWNCLLQKCSFSSRFGTSFLPNYRKKCSWLHSLLQSFSAIPPVGLLGPYKQCSASFGGNKRLENKCYWVMIPGTWQKCGQFNKWESILQDCWAARIVLLWRLFLNCASTIMFE